MRLHALAASAALTAAALTAAVSGSAASQEVKSPITSNPGPGDATALATTIVIDSTEIMLADLAKSKNVSAKVRDYADDVRDQHALRLLNARDIASRLDIKVDSATVVAEVKKKEADTYTKLKALDGAEFEKAYIDAMVKGHSAALAKIDERRKAASHPTVLAHLDDVHNDVSDHLKAARLLQGDTR
jgi:putative membrane protein